MDKFWIGVGVGLSVFPAVVAIGLLCFVAWWRVVK